MKAFIKSVLQSKGYDVELVDDDNAVNKWLDDNQFDGSEIEMQFGKRNWYVQMTDTNIAVFYEVYVTVDGIETDEVDLFGAVLFKRVR